MGARRRGGFSLIELLTVVAIMGITAIYVGRILGVNQQAYTATDQLTQVQQDLRAIDDLLERDLRHAGFMVPDSVSICGVDEINGPDTLYLSDHLAIDPQDDFNLYDGVSATVAGGSLTSAPGTATLTLASLQVEPSPPLRLAYDTDNNGTNDSDFQVGGGVIVANTADPTGGVACGTITAVDVGGNQISVDVKSKLATAASLIAVPAHEYRVDGTRLLWNGKVLAEGIEDLQVTYIIDNDDDNQVDAPDELFGDDESGAHLLFSGASPHSTTGAATGGNTLTDFASALVREVRVSLVARTRLEDEGFSMGRIQGVENRDVSAATPDGFRRRIITTKVMLRNVGIEV